MNGNLVLDDEEDRYHIVNTEYKYGDVNDDSSDECNIDTLQDAINAAMVKDTPENDSHDMDSYETSNADIFKISILVSSGERSAKTTISLYYVINNNDIQDKH